MLYQAWRGEIGDGYKGLVTVLNKGDVVELVSGGGDDGDDDDDDMMMVMMIMIIIMI
jgi:hypothetical protein